MQCQEDDTNNNQPVFLEKLWKMVNDSSTNHLISWTSSGTAFVIPNQAKFWFELLPLYYKHNNMSSFVRQLNMYGFRKITNFEITKIETDEVRFSHPFFRKDHPELLKNIKRKSRRQYEKDNKLMEILNEIKELKRQQESVDNHLKTIKNENALLWREISLLRHKYLKQQEIINKLIQFLATFMQQNRKVGIKRPNQLMLDENCCNKHKKIEPKNSSLETIKICELQPQEASTKPDDLFLNSAFILEDNEDKNIGKVIDNISNVLKNYSNQLESTQTEVSQFKEILNNCNSSFDTNILWDIFNDDNLQNFNDNLADFSKSVVSPEDNAMNCDFVENVSFD